MFDMMVSNAQRYLNNFGNNLVVDGILGSKTTDAVKQYQLKNSLVPDGRITQSLLDHMSKSKEIDSVNGETTFSKIKNFAVENKKPIIIFTSLFILGGGFYFIKEKLRK